MSTPLLVKENIYGDYDLIFIFAYEGYLNAAIHQHRLPLVFFRDKIDIPS